jgi:lactoylglutathione lyase
MNICLTTIHVNDMDAALDLYEGKLGFPVINRDNYPYVVVIKSDNFPIVLHRVDKATETAYAQQAHIVLAFQVDDLNAVFNDYKSKGVLFIDEQPQAFPAGLKAAFKDPAGNIHELMEFRR